MAFQNFFAAKLFTDIGAGDTSITLDTAPTATSGRMVLEARNPTQREIVKYTGISGNQLTGVSRGQGGTTAKPHLKNALVEMNLTAEDIADAMGVPSDIVQKIKDTVFDFIAGGGVWSGDSYGSTRNASMTAIVYYVNGERYTIAPVVARTFTASRDTYVDVTDSSTVVYTEVANNATSPALAANSVRVAIVVTGASSIVNAGSINQGQTDASLPLVSGAFLAVVDTLGNIIAPRDPNRKIIGYRRSDAVITTTSVTTPAAFTMPIRVPLGRKVRFTVTTADQRNTGSNGGTNIRIVEGATVYRQALNYALSSGANTQANYTPSVMPPLSVGLHTFGLVFNEVGGVGTATFTAAPHGSQPGPIEYIAELL